MNSETIWQQLFDALSASYRRQLLVALLEHNPQDDDPDPLDVTADGETDLDVLEIDLFHRHLPKLEEQEFIEWDRESGEIAKGPKWEEIGPIIRLIHDHRDELPDGWL